jgi:hypothetical protein
MVQARFGAWEDSGILDPEFLKGFSQFRNTKVTESRVDLEDVDRVSTGLCRNGDRRILRSGKEIPLYVEKNLVWKSQERRWLSDLRQLHGG